MKRCSTLQFRVSVLVFGFGLTMIGLSCYRQYQRDVNLRIQQFRLQAYEEGTRLAGLAQHFFRRNLPQSADLAISYASVNPELLLGVITDGNDVVRHSTRTEWRGIDLWNCPLHINPHMVRMTKDNSKGIINLNLDTRSLTAVFPFLDVKQKLKNGLVVLDYDLTGVLAAAARQATNESLALILLHCLSWRGSCLRGRVSAEGQAPSA